MYSQYQSPGDRLTAPILKTGPASQEYGDPRSEFWEGGLQFGCSESPDHADTPEQLPRAGEDHFLLLRGLKLLFYLLMTDGGERCTVYCFTAHVLLPLERVCTTRFIIRLCTAFVIAPNITVVYMTHCSDYCYCSTL